MRRTWSTLIGVILTTICVSQAPQAFKYQAVARNSGGGLLINQLVNVRITIIDSAAGGSSVYSEIHSEMTNAYGLFSFNIGGGTVQAGQFSSIQWSTGNKWVRTELDPLGGSNYANMGTNPLISVPYALFADTAKNLSGGISETDPIFGSSVANGITSLDTANWNDDKVSDGDTTYWKANANGIFYTMGNVGIGVNSMNQSSLLYMKSNNLNTGSLWVEGYVTDNPGDPAIATIRGGSDGGAILEISKQAGASRNWGAIRIGVDPVYAWVFGVNGGIGINIQPQRTLHISDVMRLEPINAAPSNPGKGDIYFDNIVNKLRVYDGTTWQDCW